MGIYVGGTGSANQIDDYEEGTWTAQMHDGSGVNVALINVTGSYTKIGRLVKVTGVVQNNESGSRSGRFEVTQLPFTAASVSQLACGSFWMDRGSGNDTVGGGIYLIGNTTKFRFVNPSAVHTNQGGDDAAKAATRYLDASQWPITKHIYFDLVYQSQ